MSFLPTYVGLSNGALQVRRSQEWSGVQDVGSGIGLDIVRHSA